MVPRTLHPTTTRMLNPTLTPAPLFEGEEELRMTQEIWI